MLRRRARVALENRAVGGEREEAATLAVARTTAAQLRAVLLAQRSTQLCLVS
jgi:hypothetical protein